MSATIYGLATGIVFGYLLQRARVLRYDKQLGALRLRDMTIVKFMLTSVLVAAVGVYALHDLGIVKLSIKPMLPGAVIVGGLLFGVGWGLLGYCPGTSLGAAGEGRLDALAGIAGMLVGAALFAETYPTLKGTLLAWGDLGKLTLPGVLGISPWIVIGAFIVFGLLLFHWFERRGL